MRAVSFHYTASPDPAQREQAGDLIDAGEQLAEKLDREKLRRACAVIVALDPTNRVIGVAAIKERQGDIAELGYLVVHPDFRRCGIAQELTNRRIEEAKGKGLRLLFTNVRQNNKESIGNLQKAGFRYWGDFVSAYHTKRLISGFFYPLAAHVDWQTHMERLTRHLKRPSVE
jgi:ribosomal protein S18 acetylase RimI-like enzyme